MLATMVFAGLRISELIALDWRDVDLAAGRIRVRQSKTDAGIRYVDLLPVLRDELDALKAARNPKPEEAVFPSAAGTRRTATGYATGCSAARSAKRTRASKARACRRSRKG